MTLRRIRSFRVPGDPVVANELAQQLAKFEQNVDDMGAELQKTGMRRLDVVAREVTEGPVLLSPGQAITVDNAVERIQLSEPTAVDAGKFAVVCRRLGLVPITLYIAPPPGRVINDDGTPFAKTNSGLVLIFCDGINYWTVD